jgi:uncharacterized protein YbaP (TraB family)
MTLLRRQCLLLLALLAVTATWALPALADEPLDEVVVSGEQPGPGLWQVRHGDHSLWILGTLSPLPAKMTWRSAEIERRIAASQLVIAPVNVSAGIGFFSGLRLLPAALRARELPKGSSLSTVLQPALYARWTPLKKRYLGSGDKFEGWRPMFAGGELYEKALESSQLDGRRDVWVAVQKLAKRHDVPIRKTEVKLTLEDPRGLLKDFTQTPLNADIDCFESLLSRTETQLPLLRQRANAWARGDVDTLRQLPLEDAETRCLDAATSTPRMASLYKDAMRRVRQDWVLVAEGALLRNASSVAVMSMREMLAADGLLAQLRARGYEITEP